MSLHLLSVALLLLCSALFSASESAFFSLKHISRPKSHLNTLMSDKLKLLSTILIGNLLVNILYFSYTSSIVFSISETRPALAPLTAFGFFMAILILAEILPKTVAINYPFFIAKHASHILIIFFRLFSPVSIILQLLLSSTKTLTDRFFHKKDKIIGDELDYMIGFAQKSGSINLKEKFMLSGSYAFDQLRAKAFMTPRNRVTACDCNISKADFINMFKKNKHSKIIVYDKNIENILGFVFTKDIFLQQDFDLASKINRLMFIPELAYMRKIYSLFLRYGFKIAAIVDEYGGFQGIITNEDIIEAIIGDINDEFKDNNRGLMKISKNKYAVYGDLSIRNWNLYFPPLPKSTSFGTLSGYLEKAFGKIPKKGDEILISNIRFTIIKVSRISIIKVIIELL